MLGSWRSWLFIGSIPLKTSLPGKRIRGKTYSTGILTRRLCPEPVPVARYVLEVLPAGLRLDKIELGARVRVLQWIFLSFGSVLFGSSAVHVQGHCRRNAAPD